MANFGPPQPPGFGFFPPADNNAPVFKQQFTGGQNYGHQKRRKHPYHDRNDFKRPRGKGKLSRGGFKAGNSYPKYGAWQGNHRGACLNRVSSFVGGGGRGGQGVHKPPQQTPQVYQQQTPQVLGHCNGKPVPVLGPDDRYNPSDYRLTPEYASPPHAGGAIEEQLKELGVEGVDMFASNVGLIDYTSSGEEGEDFEEANGVLGHYGLLVYKDNYKELRIQEYINRCPEEVQKFVHEKESKITDLETRNAQLLNDVADLRQEIVSKESDVVCDLKAKILNLQEEKYCMEHQLAMLRDAAEASLTDGETEGPTTALPSREV